MNKAKKNVVVVGFSPDEKNSLGLPSIESNRVRFVNTMSNAIKYQGYLLIYDNRGKMDLVDFDKKYRKSLRKFEKIWFYHPTYKWKYDKWSRIEKLGRIVFEFDSYNLGVDWDEYKESKNNLKIQVRFNKDKKEKLDILYRYLRNFKSIKTEQIVKDLNMSVRSVERYMQDLNNIFNSIGYDYSKNEWYFIW